MVSGTRLPKPKTKRNKGECERMTGPAAILAGAPSHHHHHQPIPLRSTTPTLLMMMVVMMITSLARDSLSF